MGEGCTVKFVAERDSLEDLRAEWRALYARAPGKTSAQHPAYFDTAREVAPPGLLFAAVTVRRAGELVGLWPLSLSRTLGCRLARHPGHGGHEEYSGMLIGPETDPADVIGPAVDEIRKHADLVEAYHLPPHAPLLDALRQRALASRTSSVISYVAGMSDAGDWDHWLRTKSANFRQHLGRQRRNLSKLGALASVQDEPAILPWFFREKRKWLEKTGKRSDWVSDPGLWERFFNALAARADSPLKTFALKLDGAYIAAVLCLVSERRLEYVSPTYATDSEWERYSPGMLVTEDCGQWAVNNGLDLDFRFNDVPYKQRWSSRTDRFVTVRAALSPQGLVKLYTDVAMLHGRRAKTHAGKTVRDCATMLKSRLAAR